MHAAPPPPHTHPPPVALHQGEHISQKESGEAALLSKSADNTDGEEESLERRINPLNWVYKSDFTLPRLLFYTQCTHNPPLMLIFQVLKRWHHRRRRAAAVTVYAHVRSRLSPLGRTCVCIKCLLEGFDTPHKR